MDTYSPTAIIPKSLKLQLNEKVLSQSEINRTKTPFVAASDLKEENDII